MAALTWQNVSAPNLPSSSRDLYYVNRMFSDALGGVGDSLSGIQDKRNQSNQAALIQRSMQFDNAGDLNEAMKSGRLFEGLDQASLTPEVLNSVSKRIGELQTQRTNTLRNDNTEYTNNRTQTQDAASDALSPFGSEISRFAAAGDQAGINSVLNSPQFQEVFSKLTPEAQSKFRDDALGTASSVDDQSNQQRLSDQTNEFAAVNQGLNVQSKKQQMAGTAFDQKVGRYNFGRSQGLDQANDEFQQKLTEVTGQITSGSAAEEYMANTKFADPRTKNQMSQLFKEQFADSFNLPMDQIAANLREEIQTNLPIAPDVAQANELIDIRSAEITSQFPGLGEAASDTTSRADVATSILNEYPDVIDETTGQITDKVRQIQNAFNINAAQAGVILKNSVEGEFRLFGADGKFDDDALRALRSDPNGIQRMLSEIKSLSAAKSNLNTTFDKLVEARSLQEAIDQNPDKATDKQIKGNEAKATRNADRLAKYLEDLQKFNQVSVPASANELIPSRSAGPSARSVLSGQ